MVVFQWLAAWPLLAPFPTAGAKITKKSRLLHDSHFGGPFLFVSGVTFGVTAPQFVKSSGKVENRVVNLALTGTGYTTHAF